MTPPPSEESRWFSEQVLPHGGQLKSFLRNAFPSVHDIDDVVQESYLRLWRVRTRESIDCAKGFLFRVARGIAIDAIRRARVSPLQSVPDLAALPALDERPSAAESSCLEDELRMLADALDSLPPRCRQIMILRKLRKMSQRDIAALLNISEQTVQAQASKGVDRCASFFAERGQNGPRDHER